MGMAKDEVSEKPVDPREVEFFDEDAVRLSKHSEF
jgi:hypothetical protein